MAEEEIELEVSEDDILYYIDDEEGNELGFAIMEDGKEVEYYYAEPIPAPQPVNPTIEKVVDAGTGMLKKTVSDNPYLTRDEVAGMASDLNSVAKENKATIDTFRELSDGIKESMEFFKQPIIPN